MDAVSNFAKYLCSDDTMDAIAHARTRMVIASCGRPVGVGIACERADACVTCYSEVIVCASSAAMALSFDAGGDRQENYWVEDLTEKDAEELVALYGHRKDWQQFVEACSLAALFALFCHEGPCAALVGVPFRRLPRSGFGANLRKVQRAGDAGGQEGGDGGEGPR